MKTTRSLISVMALSAAIMSGMPASAANYTAQVLGGDIIPTSINDKGQVAGYTLNRLGYMGFITGPDGAGMMDLNSYVSLENRNLFFSDAFAINDVGQIVAQASDGYTYLLSPVPEPDVHILMLAGIGLVGWIVRRKKQVS